MGSNAMVCPGDDSVLDTNLPIPSNKEQAKQTAEGNNNTYSNGDGNSHSHSHSHSNNSFFFAMKVKGTSHQSAHPKRKD